MTPCISYLVLFSYAHIALWAAGIAVVTYPPFAKNDYLLNSSTASVRACFTNPRFLISGVVTKFRNIIAMVRLACWLATPEIKNCGFPWMLEAARA